MENEVNGEIITQFAVLRPKAHSYLTDKNDGNKVKGTKKCVIKRKLKFEDKENCLEAN